MLRAAYGYKVLTGLKFGKWTVLNDGIVKNKNRVVPAICECGISKEVSFQSLVKGTSLTCGCDAFDKARNRLLDNPIARRLPEGEAAKNALLSGYKGKARERNLEWNITNEEFFNLTSLICHYCGATPSNIKRSFYKTGHYIYNGIDRINNLMGYVLGNLVSCCKKCNIAKNEMTMIEFNEWITAVYNNMVKK